MHVYITMTEDRRISIATYGSNPARHIMVCIVSNRFLIVDIEEFPGYVTLKMQCGIAFLVKFIIWSIIEKECDSNIWVLS
jgi:hypothetical protein